MEHANFSPSSMARVIACPASYQAGFEAPPEPPSEAAIEGTMLHDVMARSLLRKEAPSYLPEYADLTLNQQYYVMQAWEYAQSIIMDRPYEVEVRGSMTAWGVPEVWGTADIKIIAGDTLIIPDFKFGVVYVDAVRNVQMMIYAACHSGYPSDFKQFEVHVIQPKIDNFNHYDFDALELEEFVFQKLVPAIQLATKASPPYRPSESACRFCRAHATCEARMEVEVKKAQKIFAEFGQPPVMENVDAGSAGTAQKARGSTNLERLVAFFDMTESIVNFRSELGKYLLTMGLNGTTIPGKKIVNGRMSRKWRDTAALLEFIEDVGLSAGDLYESKIISPAKAEKVFRQYKKDLAQFVKATPGKPQLVDESDKRPAINENFFEKV